MNWDRIEGNWKHFKGNARQLWGKLSREETEKRPTEWQDSMFDDETVIPEPK